MIFYNAMPPKIKILIVDDDFYSVILLKEFLKKNYAVYSVNNGKEAVEFCNNHRVDLILTDILMPVMNGIDAWKEIKKTHNNIKVIAQTAFTEKNKLKEIISAGIDNIILKPYKKTDLLNMIEMSLDESYEI